MNDVSVKVSGRDWFVATVAGMASYIDASAVASTSVALVMYQNALNLDSMKIGYLSSSIALFIALGALLGGRLGDKYGRKRVFSVTMLGLAVGCVIMAVAQNFATLLIGTVVLGFFAGADLPASLALVGECAPKGARGKMITFSQILWNVGILITQIIVAIVSDMDALGARLLFCHLIIVSVIVLLLRIKLPESAQWTKESSKVRSGGGNAKEEVSISKIKSLLQKPYLPLFIGLGLFYGLAQIAASIKAQFLSYMFVNVAHSTVRAYSMAYICVMVVGLVAMFLFMRVVDGPHRRKWFVAGAVSFILSFAVPAVFGVTVPTLFVSSALSGFGAALAFEGMMKVWAQEFFPVLLLSTAQGSLIAFARILAAIMAIWAPSLLMLNASGFFAFLTGVMVVAMIIGLRLSFVSRNSVATA
ncbi:MFS transporter [uncultured Cohaesibacter sp.]|uniref:MFS transporter n=1 Tax=uncultured Cohaesibacter sp. TaxID=1002546 RepID=UPI00292D8CAC|nr:MFS transporter [uncultured Cohaesibacter sp.]